MSWGHFFLTHFPLQAVVMEGGGVIQWKDEDRYIHDEYLVSEAEMTKLEEVFEVLQTRLPKYAVSADSLGRRTDRALEFKKLTDEEIAQAANIFESQSDVHYSRSNVHINFWVGDISKMKGINSFLAKYRPEVKLSECLYFGDAPNDEPVFAGMENTIGVSNVAAYLNKMKAHPGTILQGKENSYINGVLNYLKSL